MDDVGSSNTKRPESPEPEAQKQGDALDEVADEVLDFMVDEPETLRGVGEVVMESTRLEWQAAYVVAIAFDHDEDWLAMTLGRTGQALRELRSLCELVSTESNFGQALDAAATRTANLLEDRSKLVHSVAMWNTEDRAAPTRVWWHPRAPDQCRRDE